MLDIYIAADTDWVFMLFVGGVTAMFGAILIAFIMSIYDRYKE